MSSVSKPSLIREERKEDHFIVFELHKTAFKSESEALLVTELRKSAEPYISLVFEDRGEVIGHIMFSPITIEGLEDKLIMGLAPMAVIPNRQREGIGSQLIYEGT